MNSRSDGDLEGNEGWDILQSLPHNNCSEKLTP